MIYFFYIKQKRTEMPNQIIKVQAVDSIQFVKSVQEVITRGARYDETTYVYLNTMPLMAQFLVEIPEDKKEEWAVDFTDGSVAFGSAYHNWAINVPMMQETGVNFKDIIDYCNDDKQKELAQKVPLSEVLLGMVVEHLPSPKVSQEYRVPNIWEGDIESPAGQGMITTSPDGPLAVMVTNVSVDKHAGEIATGRVYGGSIEKLKFHSAKSIKAHGYDMSFYECLDWHLDTSILMDRGIFVNPISRSLFACF